MVPMKNWNVCFDLQYSEVMPLC